MQRAIALVHPNKIGLSGEQVRLCSRHPKVHFGTIVEGTYGRRRGVGGGVHGRSSGLPGLLCTQSFVCYIEPSGSESNKIDSILIPIHTAADHRAF